MTSFAKSSIMNDDLEFVLNRVKEDTGFFPNFRFRMLDRTKYQLQGIGPDVNDVSGQSRIGVLKSLDGAELVGELPIIWKPVHVTVMFGNSVGGVVIGPHFSQFYNSVISKEEFVEWFNETQQMSISVNDFDLGQPINIVNGVWQLNIIARTTSAKLCGSGVIKLVATRRWVNIISGEVTSGGLTYFGIIKDHPTIPNAGSFKSEVNPLILVDDIPKAFYLPKPTLVMIANITGTANIRVMFKNALPSSLPYKVDLGGYIFNQIDADPPITLNLPDGRYCYKDYKEEWDSYNFNWISEGWSEFIDLGFLQWDWTQTYFDIPPGTGQLEVVNIDEPVIKEVMTAFTKEGQSVSGYRAEPGSEQVYKCDINFGLEDILISAVYQLGAMKLEVIRLAGYAKPTHMPEFIFIDGFKYIFDNAVSPIETLENGKYYSTYSYFAYNGVSTNLTNGVWSDIVFSRTQKVA